MGRDKKEKHTCNHMMSVCNTPYHQQITPSLYSLTLEYSNLDNVPSLNWAFLSTFMFLSNNEGEETNYNYKITNKGFPSQEIYKR